MDFAPRDRSTDNHAVSTTVIETVAARDSVDPVDLDRQLNDVVNPDALDALFAGSRSGMAGATGYIQFTYCGYTVRVACDGEVTVTESADTA